MRILVVCSGNTENFDFAKHQAFIYDQIEAISNKYREVEYDTYFVRGKGFKGYLNNLKKLNNKIKEFNPDLIHAHGGHIGFLCTLQNIVPTVVTFHGSDINNKKNRLISFLAHLLSSVSIFVSEKLRNKMLFHASKISIVPCGVDFNMFYPFEKEIAKNKLGIPEKENYVLFSSAFDNFVKNFDLAQKALKNFPELNIREIKNRSREEVNLLLNGAEFLIMTSFSEGSPQVIKEAMACNCPIVSVDVGDVKEIISGTEGTFICSDKIDDIADKINKVLQLGTRTIGRKKIKYLDNKIIAEKVYNIYEQAIYNQEN